MKTVTDTDMRILDDLSIPPGERVRILLQPGVLPNAMRKSAIDAIVARAVRTYALPHPPTKKWAEKWLSGEDRSCKAARAAEASAESARASAAIIAAALASVESASAAAEWEAAEMELQVLDVRHAIQEQSAQGALCSCPPFINSAEELCRPCREEYEDWMRAKGPHPILKETQDDEA